MKATDIIKRIPAGSPAGEILKIATLIAATIFLDKIGEVAKVILEDNHTPVIDIISKEEK
jgi:hypothetical protein